jgi:predicted alpha/beta-fold hydrolase
VENFIPHPLLPTGQLQTMAGIFSGIPEMARRTRYEYVSLPDGDRLLVTMDQASHDDGQRPVVVLMHGLGGSDASSYMLRHSYHLTKAGFPVVRVNHRGCGPAHLDKSREIYHSGRTGDLDTTLRFIGERWPGRKTAVIGYSFSGNLLLRYLGAGTHAGEGVIAGMLPPPHVSQALAICPPIDLEFCSRTLISRRNWHIHRYLTLHITKQARAREARRQRGESIHLPHHLDLRTFDQIYTAPQAGFASREDYYAQCSAKGVLSKIIIPTTILAAEDDPIVPGVIFKDAKLAAQVRLRLSPGGGHMGFISRHVTPLGDRRWLDAQIMAWASGTV